MQNHAYRVRYQCPAIRRPRVPPNPENEYLEIYALKWRINLTLSICQISRLKKQDFRGSPGVLGIFWWQPIQASSSIKRSNSNAIDVPRDRHMWWFFSFWPIGIFKKYLFLFPCNLIGQYEKDTPRSGTSIGYVDGAKIRPRSDWWKLGSLSFFHKAIWVAQMTVYLFML